MWMVVQSTFCLMAEFCQEFGSTIREEGMSTAPEFIELRQDSHTHDMIRH